MKEEIITINLSILRNVMVVPVTLNMLNRDD